MLLTYRIVSPPTVIMVVMIPTSSGSAFSRLPGSHWAAPQHQHADDGRRHGGHHESCRGNGTAKEARPNIPDCIAEQFTSMARTHDEENQARDKGTMVKLAATNASAS